MVLIFVLAACSGGSSTGPGDGGNSSVGGTTNLSSSAQSSSKIGFTVGSTDINMNLNADKVDLLGTFNGMQADPILTLEFIPYNWVKYNGNVANSVMQVNGTTGTATIILNGKASVDLLNSSIECNKESTVRVKACAKPTDGKENCTEHDYKFTKPADYCAISSSGGGNQTQSSSSEVKWKFGSMGEVQAGRGTENNVSDCPRFTLTERDEGTMIPYLSVTGGNVREAAGVNVFVDPGFDSNGHLKNGYEFSNSSFDFGSPSSQPVLVQWKYFYLITSGDNRCLLRIEGRGGVSGADEWSEWPKTVPYWKVTSGPTL